MLLKLNAISIKTIPTGNKRERCSQGKQGGGVQPAGGAVCGQQRLQSELIGSGCLGVRSAAAGAVNVDALYSCGGCRRSLNWPLTAFLASLPQVSRILYSFATAFRRSAKKALLSSQQAPPLTPDSDLFTFNVSLEIKEDDGKGTFRWEGTALRSSAL